MHAHQKDARRGRQSPVCQRIRDIVSRGGTIRCEKIFSSISAPECYLEEAAVINKIGLHRLCNRIAGGFGGAEGNSYAAGLRTEEQKEKIRAGVRAAFLRNREAGLDRRGRPFKEKPVHVPKQRRLSVEHRKNISNALRGRQLSAEHKQHSAQGLRGHTQSIEERALRSRLLKGRPWSDARRLAQLTSTPPAKPKK